MDHHHHHHHHAARAGGAAQANIDHYNVFADSYESEVPQAIELARTLAPLILAELPFNKDQTMVLDFACGTGLLSRELASHAKEVLGVDISQGMVNQYNRRAMQGNHTNISAILAQMAGPEPPKELHGRLFDVVVCSMAYHHFDSPDLITQALVKLLRPGGKVFVVDNILKHLPNTTAPDHQPPEVAIPHKSGFTKEIMCDMFQSAGLQDVAFDVFVHEEVVIGGVKMEQFVCSGKKYEVCLGSH